MGRGGALHSAARSVAATPWTSTVHPKSAREPQGPEQRRPRRRSPRLLWKESLAAASRHCVHQWHRQKRSTQGLLRYTPCKPPGLCSASSVERLLFGNGHQHLAKLAHWCPGRTQRPVGKNPIRHFPTSRFPSVDLATSHARPSNSFVFRHTTRFTQRSCGM